MQVAKWENSLAIRLPAGIVKEMNLRTGDEINIRVAGPREFVVEPEMNREEAIAKLRAAGSPLPRGFKFDRREADAR